MLPVIDWWLYGCSMINHHTFIGVLVYFFTLDFNTMVAILKHFTICSQTSFGKLQCSFPFFLTQNFHWSLFWHWFGCWSSVRFLWTIPKYWPSQLMWQVSVCNRALFSPCQCWNSGLHWSAQCQVDRLRCWEKEMFRIESTLYDSMRVNPQNGRL